MRTTIDMPDALGRLIKIKAAQEGLPLRTLVMRALERELSASPTPRHRETAPVLPVIRSGRPGFLKITPEEVSAVLAREEAATYAADVRR